MSRLVTLDVRVGLALLKYYHLQVFFVLSLYFGHVSPLDGIRSQGQPKRGAKVLPTPKPLANSALFQEFSAAAFPYPLRHATNAKPLVIPRAEYCS